MINPADIRIDGFKAGMGPVKYYRVTHAPTGIVVESDTMANAEMLEELARKLALHNEESAP